MTSVQLMMKINYWILRIYVNLKIECLPTHATCLDHDISNEHWMFKYKLYDKKDKFPFFLLRILHLSKNISSSIFYGSFYSETPRIDRCTLLFSDLILKAPGIFRMIFPIVTTKQLQKYEISIAEKCSETTALRC